MTEGRQPAPAEAASAASEAGLLVNDDQPLIAVPVEEHPDGHHRSAYYTSEAAADAAVTDAAVQRAVELAGAWADLDWDEAVAELDRIRHQTPPTPPVETQLAALLKADEKADEAAGQAHDAGGAAES